MNPKMNPEDAPAEPSSFFRHAHSKRFYPYGLYSDFVHSLDAYGSEFFAGIDEEDIVLSPVQGLVMKVLILVLLTGIALITIAI